MKKVFLGIDPGKDGAFAFIDEEGSVLHTVLVPSIGKDFDREEMIKVASLFDIHFAVLENVHAPQMGRSVQAVYRQRRKEEARYKVNLTVGVQEHVSERRPN